MLFKNIKYTFILALFAFALAACNNSEAVTDTDTSETESTEQTQETEAPEPQKPVSEMSYQEASEEMLRTLAAGGNTDEYVQKFSAVNVDTLAAIINTDTKRKAFWINIYNAYIQKILTENPDVYKDRKAFFGEDRMKIAGKETSFDQLEHGIIRSSTMKVSAGFVGDIFVGDYEKKLRTEEVDPRIHFAINCGAKDCPPIHILSPENLDAELDRLTEDYTKKWTTYDMKADTAATTSLISWFRGDFGGKDGAKEFLVKHGALPAGASPDLRFKGYDWTLKTGMYAAEVE